MKPHSKPDATGSSLRDKIIGLGERSIRKSYYPQLQRQLAQAEKDRRYQEDKSAALLNMLEDLEEARGELADNEARYRALVENINDVIFILDIYGKFSYISPVIQNFGGLTPEQVVGVSFKEFIHPDDLSAVAATFERVLTGLRVPQEYRVFDKKGRVYYVRTSSSPLLKDGRVVGLTGVMSDITDRKLAEIALLRLNRELHALSSCNEALLHATDEQTLLQDICTLVCDKAGYRMVWVGYAENDEAKTIRPVAWAGFEDGFLAQAGITWADTERGRGPTGTAVRTGKSCYFQDIGIEPLAAPWHESASQRGYRSSIAMPLKDEQVHIFGSLTIYSGETDAFTEEEVRLLEQLAGDLAFGITVLRARKERHRVESIMQARLRLLEYSAAHSVDELLTATLDEIEALTGSSIGFYHVVEADQKTIPLQSWSTNTKSSMCKIEGDGRHCPVDQAGVWADCIRERRTIIHNDYASLPNRKGMPVGHAPVIREVVVPIFRGDRIAAVIGIGNKLSNYDESDIAIISQLGDLTWDIAAHKEFERERHDNLERLELFLMQTIAAIAATVEARDPYTAGHEQRVAQLASAIAREMGVSDEEVRGIELAGRIHDLGKLSIPAEILSKPGRLHPIQFELIKMHPQTGFDIIKDIQFPQPIAQMVLQHHERLDGSGYPFGLKTDDILLGSRILAVADVVEAMSSHRPYRPSLGLDVALDEIILHRGTWYDPAAVDCCIVLFREKNFDFSGSTHRA